MMNPEELILSAHAGCFSMALSNEWAMPAPAGDHQDDCHGHSREDCAGFAMPSVHLTLQAKVPGAAGRLLDGWVIEGWLSRLQAVQSRH
jgi:osmotically inducible protein OsmC